MRLSLCAVWLCLRGGGGRGVEPPKENAKPTLETRSQLAAKARELRAIASFFHRLSAYLGPLQSSDFLLPHIVEALLGNTGYDE